jgi:hypothetical protein
MTAPTNDQGDWTEASGRVGVSGSGYWPWGVRGAGDFADAMWLAAEVLGNAAGVVWVNVDARRGDSAGLPWVAVTVDNPEYLYRLANTWPCAGVPDGLVEYGGVVSWKGQVNGIGLFVYYDAGEVAS